MDTEMGITRSSEPLTRDSICATTSSSSRFDCWYFSTASCRCVSEATAGRFAAQRAACERVRKGGT